MTEILDDWTFYELLLADALRGQGSGPLRLHFAPPWVEIHAADLTLLPDLSVPCGVVTITQQGADLFRIDLALPITAGQTIPAANLAGIGWKQGKAKDDSGVAVFTQPRQQLLDVAALAARTIKGLSQKHPSAIFPEDDLCGALRGFLIAATAALEGTADASTLYADLAP